MKVIESQSAVLSNFEVYQHVLDLKKRKKTRSRGPPNYENVLKEVRQEMIYVLLEDRTSNIGYP